MRNFGLSGMQVVLVLVMLALAVYWVVRMAQGDASLGDACLVLASVACGISAQVLGARRKRRAQVGKR